MRLPRIHGIEIHEQPWCPTSLRDAATGSNSVVDLCSGGGGPWLSLLARFGDDAPQVALTDRFPNRVAFERAAEEGGGRIGFEPEPIDVMRVPERLRGFRTLFAALHHFRPADARAILADAVEKRQPIAIFEGTERRVLQLLSMLLLVPIVTLLAMPFVRPFRISRIVWTYLIPLAPLVIAFDGIVSCLRTYSEDEMRGLVEGMDGYRWQIGVERSGPTGIPFIIGVPEATDRR